MPYLTEIRFNWERVANPDTYPFNITALSGVDSISLDHNVTFFVGENGCGKSTLLEALAYKCGFGMKGGGRHSTLDSTVDDLSLEAIMTLSWSPKVTNGFFLRAETFFGSWNGRGKHNS